MRIVALLTAMLLFICICVGCMMLESATSGSSTEAPSNSGTTGVPHPTTTVGREAQGLPMLTQDRMALIEAYWENYCDGVNVQKFRDPEKGKDGIRYYGSYTVKEWDGTQVTCDILYVPFPELAVPTTVELQGYRFSGRYGFALYTFTLYTGKDGEIGMRWANFAPLPDAVKAPEKSSGQGIDDAVIAYAFELHQRYEDMVGKQQTVNTPVGEAYERQRVRAAWLHCFGFLPDFDDPQAKQRYYGRYHGMDVFYYAGIGSPGVAVSEKIGNETFANGPFVLRVYIDGCIYDLRDAYAAGLVSDDTLSKIATDP